MAIFYFRGMALWPILDTLFWPVRGGNQHAVLSLELLGSWFDAGKYKSLLTIDHRYQKEFSKPSVPWLGTLVGLNGQVCASFLSMEQDG